MMGKSTDDKLRGTVEMVLSSAEAHNWQARLIASYFDPEPKRNVVSEIRASIWARPDIPEQQRQDVWTRVLDELFATAARSAAPPAPSEPEGLPEGAELEDQVI